MLRLISNCVKDESGSELIEYALLLGLIVIGCLGIMSALGVKVLAKWQSVDDGM